MSGLPNEVACEAGPRATYRKGNKDRSTRHEVAVLQTLQTARIREREALQDSDHEDMDVLSNAGARPGRQGQGRRSAAKCCEEMGCQAIGPAKSLALQAATLERGSENYQLKRGGFYSHGSSARRNGDEPQRVLKAPFFRSWEDSWML